MTVDGDCGEKGVQDQKPRMTQRGRANAFKNSSQDSVRWTGENANTALTEYFV